MRTGNFRLVSWGKSEGIFRDGVRKDGRIVPDERHDKFSEIVAGFFQMVPERVDYTASVLLHPQLR